MNLVKQIVDQISGEALNKLASLLGIDPESAGYAAGAAVPALLAGLGGLASNADGARRLATGLGSIDAGSFGDFARSLDGDSSTVMLRGGQLLQSLFGENMVSNLVGAIGNYTGLDSSSMKGLLAYLAPLVLGTVARQWRQRGGNTQALQNLFAEQRANIADAAPAGFALDDVPGFGKFADSAREAVGSAGRAGKSTAPSLASWLLPLAILIACGFLLWRFMRPDEQPQVAADREATETTVMKPVVPDETPASVVPQVQDELTATFAQLQTTLTGIRDSATAEAAAPALEETNGKLDRLTTTIRGLPETGQPPVRQLITDQLENLKTAAGKTLAIPGLSERVKMLIQNIITKLDELQTAAATTS